MVTKQNTDGTVESADSASLASPTHLDDFLNSKENPANVGENVESLSAFARFAKRKGLVKQTEAAWEAAYLAFMNDVPR